MTAPVRLRLSRRKGFNLQALSRATNGLDAVNVARPSRWGNQWKVERFSTVCSTAKQAVDLFRKHDLPKLRRAARTELRGKNLACWCPPGPCHADILLELANR